MEYRRLGQTDIEVSVICMGCWQLIGDMTWGEQEERDSIRAVHASLDCGVNFFDTAEGYGNGASEVVLRKALEGQRDKVIIATKVSASHVDRESMREHCHASLQRLGTDYVDLYQIHWPSRTLPITESLAALEELKQEGKIRAAGVSNFGPKDLKELLAHGRVESNQMNYSALWRGIEREVLPLCRDQEISVLSYSSLMQGLLTGKYSSADDVPDGRARSRLFRPDRPHARHQEGGCEQELFGAIAAIRRACEAAGVSVTAAALHYVLSHDGMTSAIVGARNAEQARANASVVDADVPPDLLAEIAAATQPILDYAGDNLDMWMTDSRIR